jgi:hypothetical protein
MKIEIKGDGVKYGDRLAQRPSLAEGFKERPFYGAEGGNRPLPLLGIWSSGGSDNEH